MKTGNYDLHLTDGWLFYDGNFSYPARMPGGDYHATSKAGGALKCLVGFDGSEGWKSISIPHDWLTDREIDSDSDATPGCKRRDVAWYKKKFILPDEPIESAELCFDGVLGIATVYVNGVTAKRNFSGYNRFSAEIGDYLLPGGENEIAVFVDARRHEGWWYEGAGIYRPVYIRFRGELHLLKEDCFVRTSGNTVLADVKFTSAGSVEARLRDSDGKVIAAQEVDGNAAASFALRPDSPKRWSPEHPSLYTVEAVLKKDGQEVDRVSFSVGFRDIVWQGDRGMLLDGDPYRIKGICCHQDHAGLGAAVYPEVEEYRILRLKSLGANAYRCAHHAPTESMLDICDRLGMLVMVENRHFNVSEDTLSQLDALVKLSRNHPCVFLYSLFNEEPWQAELRGKRIAKKLRARVRLLDDTRAVTAAQNGGSLIQHNASEALDVIGMNYNLNAYEKCHILSPEKIILGTENSPTFATRAVYATNSELQIFADNTDEYPRDFSQPLWQTMEAVEKHPFVAGCFVWSGFDHRGEPNPFEYPSVSSHWGFLDSCGFDKNIAHWLRAYYLDEPFLRFSSFADLPKEGDRRVIVFTNAQQGELFSDGRSLGVKEVKNRMLTWDVPSDAKELLAVVQKDGNEISEVCRTPGNNTRLSVTDVTPCGASGEVRILNVCITDECGIAIACENGVLSVEGDIVGVGNGDPNGHHSDKANQIPLFNGMAQVIVRRRGNVKLSYHGLEPHEMKGDKE